MIGLSILIIMVAHARVDGKFIAVQIKSSHCGNDLQKSPNDFRPYEMNCTESDWSTLVQSEQHQHYSFHCPAIEGEGRMSPVNLTCWGERHDSMLTERLGEDVELRREVCDCWACSYSSETCGAKDPDRRSMAIGLGACLGILVIVVGASVCYRLRRRKTINLYMEIDVPEGAASVVVVPVSPPSPPPFPQHLRKQSSCSVRNSGERTAWHSGVTNPDEGTGGNLLGTVDHRLEICGSLGERRNLQLKSGNDRHCSNSEQIRLFSHPEIVRKGHKAMCHEHEKVVCDEYITLCKDHKDVCNGRTGKCHGHSGVCSLDLKTEVTNGREGDAIRDQSGHIAKSDGHMAASYGHVEQCNEFMEVNDNGFDVFGDCSEFCDCSVCNDVDQFDDSVSRASIEANVHMEPAVCLLGLVPVNCNEGGQGQAQRWGRDVSRRHSVRSRGSLLSLLKPKLSSGELNSKSLTSREMSLPRQGLKTRTSSELP